MHAKIWTFWRPVHWFHWLITGINPLGGQNYYDNAQSLLSLACLQPTMVPAALKRFHWQTLTMWRCVSSRAVAKALCGQAPMKRSFSYGGQEPCLKRPQKKKRKKGRGGAGRHSLSQEAIKHTVFQFSCVCFFPVVMTFTIWFWYGERLDHVLYLLK